MGVFWVLFCIRIVWRTAVQAPGESAGNGRLQSALRGSARPFAIRDSRPYNLLFLQFRPETADTLTAPRQCVRFPTRHYQQSAAPRSCREQRRDGDQRTTSISGSPSDGGAASATVPNSASSCRSSGATAASPTACCKPITGLSVCPAMPKTIPPGATAKPQYQSLLRLADRNRAMFW